MKKSHIYVNSILADTIKKDFGMNLNIIVEKFLESIINGELQYSNGRWMSVFMRTGIETPVLENINNESVEELKKSELSVEDKYEEEVMLEEPEEPEEPEGPEGPEEPEEPILKQTKMGEISWKNPLYDNGRVIVFKSFNPDTHISDELCNIKSWVSNPETQFSKELCEAILSLKYGEERVFGDDYKKEPDVNIKSVYNFLKMNSGKNSSLKVLKSIIKQIERGMEQNGIAY